MIKTLLIFPLLLVSSVLFGQIVSSDIYSNQREKTFLASTDTVRIDTLSILSSSFEIKDNLGVLVAPSNYFLEPLSARLFIDPVRYSDTLTLSYSVFDKDYSKPIFKKDKAIIQTNLGLEDPFKYKVQNDNALDLFKGSSLQRNGSISRGMVLGNKQNLSVNSDFNLQLSGKLTDKINMLANISDSNIPIQAEGNTQQLQDFDNIFIKLYTEQASLIAGDFWMNHSEGRFMRYAKKTRGLGFDMNTDFANEKDSLNKLHIGTSLAVSKGKFSRNVFFGVEGNQGPYQLRGDENELFIIVLSGTERVYIDGVLLTRGEDQDYVIDYNAAEVVFTANNLITKDRQITVEFQYSDKNYARTALAVTTDLKKENSNWAIDFYSEQDSKNQPLQQDLSDAEKLLLSNIGDNINQAIISSLDTVTDSNSEVLYMLTDSLGFDSVYVYQPGSDGVQYRLSFTFFGSNQGDYVQDGFTPNGRKFKWVAPIEINGQLISQGDYRPVRKLITPQKRQMLTGRYGTKLSKSNRIFVEGSMSNRDVNTFSSIGDADNIGLAFHGGVEQLVALDSSLKLIISADHEWKDNRFSTIERYRSVEFNTDWNYQILESVNEEHLSNFSLALRRKKTEYIRYDFNSFISGSDYQGLKNDLGIDWTLGTFEIKSILSLMNSKGDTETEYLRHRGDFSRNFKRFKIGVRDDIESNKFFTSGGDSLRTNSFAYFDFEYYIGNNDTTKSSYRLYFRDRIDKKSNGVVIKDANEADEFGAKYAGKIAKDHFLELSIARRSLRIIDSTSIGFDNQKAEDSFLGKFYYRGVALKRGLIFSSFYDISSGLERKREFIYLEVPAGQGVYVWVDYNENNVKELQEFEIAKFPFEANYIRTFTLTNDFQKTYANSFAQNLEIKPENWWRDSTGYLKFISRFSNLNAISISRKTLRENQETAFNPFLKEIDNISLISLKSSLRSIVYFNKSNQKWGANFTYNEIANKSLLSNGFEARNNTSRNLGVNWNVTKQLRLEQSIEEGNRKSKADYSATRDYDIFYQLVEANIQYQPSKNYRLTLSGAYNDKINRPDDIEIESQKAVIQSLGLEGRYSAVGKGNIQGGFNVIRIDYDGQSTNSLSFEMLEGLATGTNLTWTLLVQQSLMKNLELTLNYNARKSEGETVIHTGGMQLRAVF